MTEQNNKKIRTCQSLKKCALVLLTVSFIYMACGCGFSATGEDIQSKSSKEQLIIEPSEEEIEEASEKENLSGDGQISSEQGSETLCVYVCGAVKASGVYEIPAGSRIVDAIEAAGGATKKAAKERLNLAEHVQDGQRLYVPSIGEALMQPEEKDSGSESVKDSNSLVNLNYADKEELMTLPGIGESKAQDIINYRNEKGSFQSIDELKNINGIKDGVFNKIKNQITVG